jgi:hypothetical protein
MSYVSHVPPPWSAYQHSQVVTDSDCPAAAVIDVAATTAALRGTLATASSPYDRPGARLGRHRGWG